MYIDLNISKWFLVTTVISIQITFVCLITTLDFKIGHFTELVKICVINVEFAKYIFQHAWDYDNGFIRIQKIRRSLLFHQKSNDY